MWLLATVFTFLLWGTADLFYKRGARVSDRYSHLKTTMMVGVVMGLHAAYTLLFGDIGYDFRNLYMYLPVSAMYILSMAVGYFGLRYLELSVSSPIQNASGAVVCILCLLFLGERMDLLSAIAVAIICVAVLLLGIVEKREGDKERLLAGTAADSKYRVGFVALLFPVAYCVIDSLGTFFDAYYLDDLATTRLVSVTEDTMESVANTSYELTFFFAAVCIFIFLCCKRERILPQEQTDRTAAAIFETAGQFFYVRAMAGNAVVAAPVVASYCILSVLWSRLFLKERLSKMKYALIAAVFLGILLLGIEEGLSA